MALPWHWNDPIEEGFDWSSMEWLGPLGEAITERLLASGSSQKFQVVPSAPGQLGTDVQWSAFWSGIQTFLSGGWIVPPENSERMLRYAAGVESYNDLFELIGAPGGWTRTLPVTIRYRSEFPVGGVKPAESWQLVGAKPVDGVKARSNRDGQVYKFKDGKWELSSGPPDTFTARGIMEQGDYITHVVMREIRDAINLCVWRFEGDWFLAASYTRSVRELGSYYYLDDPRANLAGTQSVAVAKFSTTGEAVSTYPLTKRPGIYLDQKIASWTIESAGTFFGGTFDKFGNIVFEIFTQVSDYEIKVPTHVSRELDFYVAASDPVDNPRWPENSPIHYDSGTYGPFYWSFGTGDDAYVRGKAAFISTDQSNTAFTPLSAPNRTNPPALPPTPEEFGIDANVIRARGAGFRRGYKSNPVCISRWDVPGGFKYTKETT